MSDKKGVIYILTNPSFPDYVKIGYADDIDKRLKQLNRSECIPFAFRVYATYEVNSRLSDLKLHAIIDKLNPDLRSIDDFKGQKRIREFYAMKPEEAYAILDAMAEIHITGNITPSIWYKTILRDNGKPYLLAIAILSDIVYWYRPMEMRDERTGGIIGWK